MKSNWHALLPLALLSATAGAEPRSSAEALARTDPWLSRVLAGDASSPSRADVLDVRFGPNADDPIERLIALGLRWKPARTG